MSEKGVQVIDRTLDILELLSLHRNGLGITEISNHLDLNKSTVHRIVQALYARMYIEKIFGTKNYKIGLKFFEIGSLCINNIELKTEAKPYLSNLSSRTAQTLHLGILDETDVVYIDKVDVYSNLHIYSEIGKRISVHCSSLGKILVSSMTNKEIASLLNNFNYIIYTDKTITNKKDFIKEVEFARKNGYAVDNEEHELGIICISAPIYDYRQKLIAAISITMSKEYLKSSNKEDVIALIVNCAKEISLRLGYQVNSLGL